MKTLQSHRLQAGIDLAFANNNAKKLVHLLDEYRGSCAVEYVLKSLLLKSPQELSKMLKLVEEGRE